MASGSPQVLVNTPSAAHRRNSHDYLKDATAEWPVILLLEDILALLIDAKLSGSTGLDAYMSLSHGLDEAADRFQGWVWNDAARGFCPPNDPLDECVDISFPYHRRFRSRIPL